MDRTVTRVIHVKHLVGYIVGKWKLLLLGMLIGVCAFSGVGIVTIVRSQQRGAVTTEKKKKISVTEAEFAGVQGIIDFEELLEEKQAYMDNSIIMKLDPLHKWNCTDVYTVTFLTPSIETEEGEEVAQATTGAMVQAGNVPDKVNALVGLFSQQSFWERLSDKTVDQVEVGYLREIVSASVVTTDKFRVVVAHVDERSARELSNLVEQCLLEVVTEKDEYQDYEIMNEKGAPIESVDHGLIETQKNAQIQLMGLREGLANRNVALTDNMKSYLDLYRQAKEQEDYEEGQPLEKITTVTNKVLSFSFQTMKSYIVKGLSVGLIGAIAFLILLYSFHPCVLCLDSVEEMFGLRVLNDRQSSLMTDKDYQLVVSKMDVNIPEQIKLETRILLTGSVIDGLADERVQTLKAKLEAAGMKVGQCPFLKEHPENMKELKGAKQVVLVEQLGKTRVDALAWEVSLCEESHKEIGGVVFL